MKKLSLLFVASALTVGSAYACGGGDPPKTSNDVSSATASSASTDVTPTTSASQAATTAPAAEAPPLAVDGIKMVGKGKDGKAITIEVKADGSVTKDGKTLATFAKNELKDDTGKTMFVVDKDGKVTSPELTGGTMAFNDKNDIQVDGKPAIAIADDGTPSVTSSTKTEKAPFKFEKLPANSKRAAALLVALMLLPKSTGPATSMSATPASSGTKPPPAASGAKKP
jgi:hypothetical protein